MDTNDKNFSRMQCAPPLQLAEFTSVKKIIDKMFGDMEKISTFAPFEPAKPLSDAQIGGSFIYIGWRGAV